MWQLVTPDLPYLQDPDYLKSVSFYVRSALGPDVEIDPSLAEAGYQLLEVATDDEAVLQLVPLIRSVRRFMRGPARPYG